MQSVTYLSSLPPKSGSAIGINSPLSIFIQIILTSLPFSNNNKHISGNFQILIFLLPCICTQMVSLLFYNLSFLPCRRSPCRIPPTQHGISNLNLRIYLFSSHGSPL